MFSVPRRVVVYRFCFLMMLLLAVWPGLTPLSMPGSVASADPNLKDAKLWIGRKQIVKMQPRRTSLTTLEQSPVMRNMFKDYHEKSRGKKF